jgi:hypothetical protein
MTSLDPGSLEAVLHVEAPKKYMYRLQSRFGNALNLRKSRNYSRVITLTGTLLQLAVLRAPGLRVLSLRYMKLPLGRDVLQKYARTIRIARVKKYTCTGQRSTSG